MSDLIRFLLPLILAYAFSLVINQRARNRLMPIVFAYLLWADVSGKAFAPSVYVYYLVFLLEYLGYAFLLSDFKRTDFSNNPALNIFCLMYGWLLLAVCWGDYPRIGFKMYSVVLRSLFVGYAVGSWSCRMPDGFGKLLRAVTAASFFIAIQYYSQGAWNAADISDAGGRLVVDVSNLDAGDVVAHHNVNVYALIVSGLLPYPFLQLFSGRRGRCGILFFLLAAVAVLVLTLVVVKTGSRNGGLALVILALYFFFAKTGLLWWKKMLALILCGGIVVGAIVKMMGENELRVFKFKNEDETSFEDMGTGRGRVFLNWWDPMSDGQHIVGIGTPTIYLEDGRHFYNMHSIYLQMLVNGGYVGLGLMLLFYLVITKEAFCNKQYKYVILLFFLLWAATGVGEGANLTGQQSTARYGLGLALALCKRRRFNIFPCDCGLVGDIPRRRLR